MLPQTIDYLVAVGILSGIAIAVPLDTRSSDKAGSAEVPHPAPVTTQTLIPSEPETQSFAETEAQKPPLPEESHADQPEESAEDASLVYLGGGRLSEPQEDGTDSKVLEIAKLPEFAVPVPGLANPTDESRDSGELAETPVLDGEFTDRVFGAANDLGLDAPSYAIINLQDLLAELVLSGDAIFAVAIDHGGQSEIYYATTLEEPSFRMATSQRNLERFALGRRIPYQIPELIARCAEQYPINPREARGAVYVSRQIDSSILQAQREHAESIGLPLNAIANTEGRLVRIGGSAWRFEIQDAQLRRLVRND